MPVPLWAGHYIGLPFKVKGRDRAGMDCWGLVRLVLNEQYGVSLPSFADGYDDVRSSMDAEKIGGMISASAAAGGVWNPVIAGQEIAGDVVVVRMQGHPMHVGLVLGDAQMLHIMRGINSCIENYHRIHWKDRIYGFYRYSGG